MMLETVNNIFLAIAGAQLGEYKFSTEVNHMHKYFYPLLATSSLER